MKQIIIAPLAAPGSITLSAYRAICETKESGAQLYLQTENHPSAEWIKKENIPYESMDAVYEASDDFDDLNRAIAEKVTGAGSAVYAVCGRGISPELEKCIRDEAKKAGLEVCILPSSGYAEAAAASCGFSVTNGACFCANSLPREIDVTLPLCIEEIDSIIRAGEVKLALSEFYPDEHEVIFAYLTGEGYRTRAIPLYELDRQSEYFAATTLLVKPCSFLELDRYGMSGVEEIMRILRAPGGCPWDIKQTHESLKESLIEEAYEVLDTILNDDMDGLCEELGDLLLQIVFHAQIETEKASFTMRDICTGLVKKLIFRHPHVFASAEGVNTADDVLRAWEVLKKEEKEQKTQSEVLRAVPKAFPALMRARKLQKRAAAVGFDWDSAEAAFPKIVEETREVKEAMRGGGEEHIMEEVGDLLFAVVNVARLLCVEPEFALAAACDKFTDRFCAMESMIIADGKDMASMTLDEMDEYWDRCKMAE